MKALILKPFAYSADGVRVCELGRDEVVEIRDDLAAGLVAEGFIAAAPADDSPTEDPAEDASTPPQASEPDVPDADPPPSEGRKSRP